MLWAPSESETSWSRLRCTGAAAKLSHPVSLFHFRANPASSHFLSAVLVPIVLRMTIKPQSLFFVQFWSRLRLFDKVVLVFYEGHIQMQRTRLLLFFFLSFYFFIPCPQLEYGACKSLAQCKSDSN